MDKNITITPKADDNDIAATVDSLSRIYNKIHNDILLDSINSYSCIADASLAEAIDEIAAHLYRDNRPEFSNYLYNHPMSCIESAFIRGVSAEISPEETKVSIRKKNSMIAVIEKDKDINERKRKYLLSIIKRVDPNALD